MVRLDHVRARQCPRSPVQRDPGASAPFPPAPPQGRQPDRLREDLQEGRRAGPGRRDRQGVRVREGQVRLHGGRGLRRGARRGLQDDRHHRLRPLRGHRPDLLLEDVLRRARPGRGTRVLAAREGNGGFRPCRRREVRHARPAASRRPARAGRSDHARAAVLRG